MRNHKKQWLLYIGKNRVWNKANDFATSSLLYERCNNSSARPMRKGPDFSLLYE